MKKFVALLIAVCLAFAVFTGCDSAKTESAENTESAAPTAAAAEESPDAETEDAAETAETKTVDYAAIYAAHEPEEIVMTADGKDVTWAEYFYCFYTYASRVENYFTQMSYYGLASGWEDAADEDGRSYAALLPEWTENMLRQIAGIESYAEENALALDAGDEEALKDQLSSDIAAVVGEDGTEEEFDEAIAAMYIPRDMYDRVNRTSVLYTKGFEKEYGENGEKISDEDAVKYLEDEGYLSAAHILLMTIDPDTGESLSEDEIAEKKASAEKIYEELSAIEDTDKRAARFKELKDEYCEDSGKEAYPDGYVFTEGTMVTEFEDAVKALKDNEIAAPVETSYGYHVIMRLPADADRVVYDTGYSARMLCANDRFGEEMQGVIDGVTLVPADGFTAPAVTDYMA